MRRTWIVAVGVVAVASIWWLGPLGGDGEIAPSGTHTTDATVHEPELRGMPAPSPAVTVPPAESPAPSVEVETPTPGDVMGIDITIRGVVKKMGSDEVLADARVLGTTQMIEQMIQQLQRMPTESTGEGRFALRVTNPSKIPTTWFVDNEGWTVADWRRDDDAERHGFDPLSDDMDHYDVTIWVTQTFRVRGQVVDEAGLPIENVPIQYVLPRSNGAGKVIGTRGRATTDRDGRFEVGPFPEHPERLAEALGDPATRKAYLRLTLNKAGFTTAMLDVYEVPAEQRGDVQVVLRSGATWAGRLLDPDDNPLPGVVVEMHYDGDPRLRRAVTTDADGQWQLDRLTFGEATLLARVFDHDAKAKLAVEIQGDRRDVRLLAEPLSFHRPDDILDLFGLSFVEVDDSIRAAFELPEHAHVMFWDPGVDAARLQIGTLRRGFGLWYVGQTPVVSLAHAVQLFGKEAQANPGPDGSIRVVYTYWTEKSVGSNTQHMHIDTDDRAALERLWGVYEDRFPKQEPAADDEVRR